MRAHQSSSACVSSQPLWKPPGLWSRLAVPPSGKWLMGRCRSARRWRRSCCSLVELRCPGACGLYSSPWNPVWDIQYRTSNHFKRLVLELRISYRWLSTYQVGYVCVWVLQQSWKKVQVFLKNIAFLMKTSRLESNLALTKSHDSLLCTSVILVQYEQCRMSLAALFCGTYHLMIDKISSDLQFLNFLSNFLKTFLIVP